MNPNDDLYQLKWKGCRAIIVFIVISFASMTKFLLSSYIQTILNDGTWDLNDFSNCFEYKYYATTGVLECKEKRYESREYLYLGVSIVFLIMAVLVSVLLSVILKCLNSRTQQSCQELSRRQEMTLARPVIAISTVSRDYGINNTRNTNLRALSDSIALSPPVTVSEADNTPPEYLPPPAYNECVINESPQKKT